MRTATILAGFGLLAGAVAVGGTDQRGSWLFPEGKTDAKAAPAPIDPAVEALVKDLGSPDYRTREKAGEALAAKGEKVLADLRRALGEADDPEVSRRLAVLIRKMDHDRLISPKKVTFALKDAPAKDAIDEIAKQTGYKLDTNSLGGGGGQAANKYSFTFEGTPFWEALDTVANTAGLYVGADYGDDTIRVYNQDTYNPHVAYAGPFRFMAQNINANRSVQLSGISRRGGFPARQNEYIGFSFQIHSEPKNAMLGTMQAEALTATDENGVSLVPPRNPNDRSSNYYNSTYRGHSSYGNLNLVRGSKDATTIKSLKGRINIVLLAGTLPEVVIDNPLKAKELKLKGRNVELDYASMTEANGTYSVTLTLRNLAAIDPNRGIDYNWSNNVWQKLELFDDKGNKFFSYGPNSINNNGTTVQLTIPFGPDNRRGGQAPKMGVPVRLVFNEWIQVTHEVSFEFKNLPLP